MAGGVPGAEGVPGDRGRGGAERVPRGGERERGQPRRETSLLLRCANSGLWRTGASVPRPLLCNPFWERETGGRARLSCLRLVSLLFSPHQMLRRTRRLAGVIRYTARGLRVCSTRAGGGDPVPCNSPTRAGAHALRAAWVKVQPP